MCFGIFLVDTSDPYMVQEKETGISSMIEIVDFFVSGKYKNVANHDV